MQRAMQIAAHESQDIAPVWTSMDEARGLPTERERDVMAWAARGKTSSETYDILKIAEATVIKYIANALAS